MVYYIDYHTHLSMRGEKMANKFKFKNTRKKQYLKTAKVEFGKNYNKVFVPSYTPQLKIELVN